MFHLFLLFACSSDGDNKSDLSIGAGKQKSSISVDPNQWNVDSTSESTGKEPSQVFTFRNTGRDTEIAVKKINLLKKTTVGTKLLTSSTALFNFQIPVSKNGIIEDQSLFPEEKLLTYSNDNLKPLCPLGSNSNKDVPQCSGAFNGPQFNSELKVKVNFDNEVVTMTPDSGIYYLELCTDGDGGESSETCGEDGVSYRATITRIDPDHPVPTAILNCGNKNYQNRELFELLTEDAVLDASKSGFYDSEGRRIENKKYALRYKWSFAETPTRYQEGSQLYSNSNPDTLIEEQWLDESIVQFRGYVTTPMNVKENENFDENRCNSVHQKIAECKSKCEEYDSCQLNCIHDNLLEMSSFCEKFKDNEYMVKLEVSAENVETSVIGPPSTTYCSPQIMRPSRVEVTLLWEGYGNKGSQENIGTKTGVDVDLNIHLVKADHFPSWNNDPMGYSRGHMCTMHGTDTEIATETHDDCYFDDAGLAGTETNGWNGQLLIDNKWGFGPETIGLGLLEKNDGKIEDGDYLVVVDYFRCEDFEGKGRCETEQYENVEAKIVMKVNGRQIPREGTGDTPIIRKIRINRDEYIPVARINWSNSREDSTDYSVEGEKRYGDAVVTDETANYRICTIDPGYCDRVPIFDKDMYYNWVENPESFDNGSDDNYHYMSEPRGECSSGTYREERKPEYVEPR